MNNKKFAFSFVIISVLVQIFIFALYYLINPEQFYKDSITEKKFFYTKEFSRKQFNQLKSKEYTLIFGTSHVHMISSDLLNTSILNFHNLYGETGDIKNFLFQLNKIQIKNISSIVLLIDLRAGMVRNDSTLINYSEKSYFPPLSIESVKRIYYDVKRNHNKNYSSFLNNDGSSENLNSKSHIKYINQLSGVAKINYNDRLISDLIEINNFTKKHNINIRYITPVSNDKYFKILDLDHLYPFYKTLLEQGLPQIGLFYFIEGISDLKNEKEEYVSFMEKDHLNIISLKIWLDDYIFTNNSLYIKNVDDLNNYLKDMKKKQSSL